MADSLASPLPDNVGTSGKAFLCRLCLLAAPPTESLVCGRGGATVGRRSAWAAAPSLTSCPALLAVQVPQDVIVNLAGDLLLLKHLFDGLAGRCCLNPLSLLLGLVWLQKD